MVFSVLKNTFKKIYNQFSSQAKSILGYKVVDEKVLDELESVLISADAGVATTRLILNKLREKVKSGEIEKGQDLKGALADILQSVLKQYSLDDEPSIYVLVGVNGSGKTTSAGKLAQMLHSQGKKVLLVAADTFRAAAQEQLSELAKKVGVDIECGKPGQDPASVVYAGISRFNNEGFDCVIVDTAGRLQTKTNLMRELEKIKRVVEKQASSATISTLLTIDAMLGQNSIEQAKLFNDATSLSGVILTKIDGTGKGGVVFAISHELSIPIAYVTFGEVMSDIDEFDSKRYVDGLLDFSE